MNKENRVCGVCGLLIMKGSSHYCSKKPYKPVAITIHDPLMDKLKEIEKRIKEIEKVLRIYYND